MNERLIPEGGSNPYANHPGFDAQGCELQTVVTQSDPWGNVRGGFGCYFTGGHCLPGEGCAAKRLKIKEQKEFMDKLNQT